MFKRILKKTIICAIVVIVVLKILDFFTYPETYLTTWKYQLENDLKEGKPEAVEYYTERYYKTDRDLFGDDFAILEKGGAE